MKLALELAEEFRGKTSPNPMVGAVVVKNGKIVGCGAHQFAGGHHAEVFALDEAGEKAKDATLYVTLEPCCHHGKTPPCTERIIKAGISKVVIAVKDPNSLVAGKGIQQLKAVGIEVKTGILEDEAKKQNEIFFHYIQTKKPFVITKAAISLDGKIATSNGNAKWISNAESRIKTHEMRNQVDAILIGKNTLINDDPNLNVRLDKITEGPQKIVIIPKLDITAEQLSKMKIYKWSKTKQLIIICHESYATNDIINKFQNYNIQIINVSGTPDSLAVEEILTKLGQKEIISLLLEGGGGVYTSFLKANFINKFHIFQASIIIGNDGIPMLKNLSINSIDSAYGLENVAIEKLSDNLHIEGYLNTGKLPISKEK
jgi:diaminohydroxyphosphoribosylaminopyrimidine deaminase / 5-amino-6-(5-phosphoribosylamino)uracil reductase